MPHQTLPIFFFYCVVIFSPPICTETILLATFRDMSAWSPCAINALMTHV